MYTALPQTSAEFELLRWADIEPWYLELLAVQLTATNVEGWLRQWSQLSALVDETNNWLHILTTRDTANESYAQRRARFLDEVFGPVQHADQQVKTHLLASGLEPEGFSLPLRKLRVDSELFREENVPLLNDVDKLVDEYFSINGAQQVLWDGQKVAISQLLPEMQSPDRTRREPAWRTYSERKLQDRNALNEVWVKLLHLRLQMANNAGFADYRSYRWKQLYRFEYMPEDCKALHEAVRRVIVPVANEIADKRRQLLGLDVLRPWDVDVDPRNDKEPRKIENVAATLAQCADLFAQVDPALGEYVATMIEDDCFDLDERDNKAPGGYCNNLEVRHLPFIFGQLQTTNDLLDLVFHETGHAFQTFEARHLPYIHQRVNYIPIEFNEVASMSMEYIGGEMMAPAGLLTQEEARSIRISHLENALLILTRVIQGDAFQHWMYENPDLAQDPERVSQTWAELGRLYQPYIDWTECEEVLKNGWQKIPHFFVVPFYYIEYVYARIGALQVWRN
ncbi:MAG TPA: M3 family oligoendopeptidase [Ktedonobacterales bacterium]|nr:M3 family oligoendopeptidase [Ktedonobacterales bacterium]